MDSWEWNKIAGAVLGTLIFVVVLGILTEAVYQPHQPAKPGYSVPGVTQTAATPAAAPAAPVEEPLPDFAKVIPTADVAHGEKVSHFCAQCHDWSKGGPNRIGPNLYGVLGRPRASHPGFDYSSAMKAKGGNWTYAELFRFLKKPQEYISGTKMTFAGLPSAQDRIDLIAYIRSWADSPEPLPAPDAAAPAPKK